jgi:hypothetical protein
MSTDAYRTLTIGISNALVRGTANFPNREPDHLDVPGGTTVTVNDHPVPGYVSLIGTLDGRDFLAVVRRDDLSRITHEPTDENAGRYAWVIDTDHLAVQWPDMTDDAGTTGPSDAPSALLARLADGDGRRFRTYDDDGELYYSGRFLAADDPNPVVPGRERPVDDALGEDAFGPLDDFAKPNAGAVRIDYLTTRGSWDTL